MASNFVEWFVQLVDVRTNRPIADSTGTCQVLTQNSPVKLTIYGDSVGTSATNPVTLTNGVARFWTDVATTAADLSIVTANGHALFLEDVTTSLHRVNVNPDQADQCAVVAWFVTASGVVADSGVSIPTAARVYDAFVRIFAPASGAVLDVGTSTAATGFMVGVTVEVTGTKANDESASVATAGSKGTLLLAAATATLTNCLKYYIPANATSAAKVVWQHTTASSAGSGYIYLRYVRMPGI